MPVQLGKSPHLLYYLQHMDLHCLQELLHNLLQAHTLQLLYDNPVLLLMEPLHMLRHQLGEERDHDLEVLVRLVEHALYRLADVLGVVEVRDAD